MTRLMRMTLAAVSGLASASLVCSTPLWAQARQPVEQFVAVHQQQILTELVNLVSIPNVAADRPNIRRNAEHLRELLLKRRFAVELLETGTNPLVFAELRVPGARQTVLFYAHYDGQPVNPKEWHQASPFTPILRTDRIENGGKEVPGFLGQTAFPPASRLYARSSSDDKAPIVALLAAIDTLQELKRPLTSNVKVILDGEEEVRSGGLASTMGRYRDKDVADLMLVLDGPLHSSGQPTLSFGGRGNLVFQLTAYGAKVALHSGHYGNWAPNPALDLVRLLASMKDEQGRVLVKGFYDDVPPLSAEEKQVLAAVPERSDDLMSFFGIGRTEQVGANLQEALQFPSLNIRGLQSGDVGDQARTIIPDQAIAEIDVRLVKETEPERMLQRILTHIRDQGIHVIVDGEPDDAMRARYPRIVRVSRVQWTKPYRTDMDLPQSKRVIQALERTWGAPPVRLRTQGGTVPIDFFIQALGVPAIAVPVVNFDNNQHSNDENLKLDNLWKAIVSLAALLEM